MSTPPAHFDLSKHGITVAEDHHNLFPSALYEHAIRFENDACGSVTPTSVPATFAV